MPRAVSDQEFVPSNDAQMSKLDKGYSSDGEADPETGGTEPMPTRMGMEISFKVRANPVPRPHNRVELQRQPVVSAPWPAQRCSWAAKVPAAGLTTLSCCSPGWDAVLAGVCIPPNGPPASRHDLGLCNELILVPDISLCSLRALAAADIIGESYLSNLEQRCKAASMNVMPAEVRHGSAQDLTYTVNNSAKRGDKLALLRDVSGFFLPGQMSALVRALYN